MKRILVATAIALLILAFTATAAVAHGRHTMQVSAGCKNDCPECCAHVIRKVRSDSDGYHFSKNLSYREFSGRKIHHHLYV